MSNRTLKSALPKRDREEQDKVDAIALLESDHKELRGVFDAFKSAKTQNGHDDERKKTLVDQMVELLKVHTEIEDKVFYPETRKLVPELDPTVLVSYEEHHVADTLCKELSKMKPSDENFVAKTGVLMDCVTRHMNDEEKGWFPHVRDALTVEQLEDIGARMAKLKKDYGEGLIEKVKHCALKKQVFEEKETFVKNETWPFLQSRTNF